MAEGTILEWHAEDGWGVIESADTPGGCWAHFSNLWADEIPIAEHGQRVTGGGYRDARVGEPVDFTWENADQDGYRYRAISVNPRRPGPVWSVVTGDAIQAFRSELAYREGRHELPGE